MVKIYERPLSSFLYVCFIFCVITRSFYELMRCIREIMRNLFFFMCSSKKDFFFHLSASSPLGEEQGIAFHRLNKLEFHFPSSRMYFFYSIFVMEMGRLGWLVWIYLAVWFCKRNKTRGPQALTVRDFTLNSCQKGAYLHINSPILESTIVNESSIIIH